MGEQRLLRRSRRDRRLGGVCGGVAEYFGLDSTWVRLAWAVGSILAGFGVVLYLICWLIIPEATV